MNSTFFDVPATGRYALRNVTAPACLLPDRFTAGAELRLVDVLIANGAIAGIEPAGTMDAGLGPDLDRSMILPGLIDCHTHLDKGHIWPRMQNATGDPVGASAAAGDDRKARWSAEDVRRRMEFALQTAYAHGVVAIRTHLDSQAPQAAISFPVFCDARDRWAGRIELQASSIIPIDAFLTDEGREIAEIVARSGARLGCSTAFKTIGNVPLPPEFDRAMLALFALATEHGLDVDLHVDETGDRDALTLLRIAQLAVQYGFGGSILCGHCCSLALQSDERLRETLDACFAAGIDIVSLPTVNMFLQGRGPGVTPRWRGVAPLLEIRARGLRVAIAGDNARDPFHAYGDHDMLDTFVQAVKIAHLDYPVGDWIEAVTATPAAIMRLPDRGVLRPGVAADVLVLRARNYSELLARSQSDRVVLRGGRAIDTTPPDYRTLDDLMTADLT